MPYWAYDYPCRIDHEARDDNWRMPWLHCHRTYEIYFLDEGHTNVMIGDKLQWISAGNVVLYSPMVLHRSVSREAHSRWCLYFSREYLEEHFTPKAIDEMLSCFKNPVVKLSRKSVIAITEIMRNFLAAQESGDDRRYMLIPHILLILSESAAVENSPQNAAGGVFAAINYINDNFKHIKGVDEIARAGFVSKEYLCRAFKRSTGYTVIQYLNNLRVNSAAELLTHTDKNVTEIAFECGFSSLTYFGHVFKEQMGETPQSFRKAVEHKTKSRSLSLHSE